MNVNDLPERFQRKILIDSGSGCWVWIASKARDGYGAAWDGTTVGKAHRIVYEQLVGPVERHLDLDHLCRVRSCVNPEHMEVVSRRENVLRGVGPTAINYRRTHCLRAGHELSGSNVYIKPRTGHRECKACARELRLLRNSK